MRDVLASAATLAMDGRTTAVVAAELLVPLVLLALLAFDGPAGGLLAADEPRDDGPVRSDGLLSHARRQRSRRCSVATTLRLATASASCSLQRGEERKRERKGEGERERR